MALDISLMNAHGVPPSHGSEDQKGEGSALLGPTVHNGPRWALNYNDKRVDKSRRNLLNSTDGCIQHSNSSALYDRKILQ